MQNNYVLHPLWRYLELVTCICNGLPKRELAHFRGIWVGVREAKWTGLSAPRLGNMSVKTDGILQSVRFRDKAKAERYITAAWFEQNRR